MPTPTPTPVPTSSPLATELRWPTPAEFLRLQCPICWRAPMFRHPLAMNPSCPHCHYTYDRGNGYFLGAMFGSYAIVIVLEAILIGAMVLAGLPWQTALVIGAASVLLVGPLVAFPYSRLFWVMSERRMLRSGEGEDDALRAELARRREERDHAAGHVADHEPADGGAAAESTDRRDP